MKKKRIAGRVAIAAALVCAGIAGLAGSCGAYFPLPIDPEIIELGGDSEGLAIVGPSSVLKGETTAFTVEVFRPGRGKVVEPVTWTLGGPLAGGGVPAGVTIVAGTGADAGKGVLTVSPAVSAGAKFTIQAETTTPGETVLSGTREITVKLGEIVILSAADWARLPNDLDAPGHWVVYIPGAVQGVAGVSAPNLGPHNVNVTIRGAGSLTLAAGSTGSLLYIESGRQATLVGPALAGHSTNPTGGFEVPQNPVVRVDGGTLSMQAGAIRDNGDRGVLVENGGSFTMTGGVIENNTWEGVYVWDERSFFFLAGAAEITANHAAGVWVSSHAFFAMSGGAIRNNHNSTQYGGTGGVDISGNSSFTMSGGTISGNIGTKAGSVGGVYVEDSSFTMSGGTISGNSGSGSGSVGGVRLDSGSAFTMRGGTISGNSGARAGGVLFFQYVPGASPFTKTGGIIYGGDEGENSNTFTSPPGYGGDTLLIGYTDGITNPDVPWDTTLGENDNWPQPEP